MIQLQITLKAGALEYDKRGLKNALRAAGREVASIARANIRRSQGAGKAYYRPGGGRYRGSAPGQSPVNRTGALAAGLTVRPFKSGEGVAIRDTTFYSLFLEKGAHGGGGDTRQTHLARTGSGMRRMKKSAIGTTRDLKPRPFLESALESREDSIRDRLRAAVLDGVKFKRMKA